MAQCQGIKKDGKRCQYNAKDGQYCRIHKPVPKITMEMSEITIGIYWQNKKQNLIYDVAVLIKNTLKAVFAIETLLKLRATNKSWRNLITSQELYELAKNVKKDTNWQKVTDTIQVKAFYKHHLDGVMTISVCENQIEQTRELIRSTQYRELYKMRIVASNLRLRKMIKMIMEEELRLITIRDSEIFVNTNKEYFPYPYNFWHFYSEQCKKYGENAWGFRSQMDKLEAARYHKMSINLFL